MKDENMDRNRANVNSTELLGFIHQNGRSKRRVSKTLVEFTIGVVGLIGIMLALIAGEHRQEYNQSNMADSLSVVYQLGENVSNKVVGLKKSPPPASQLSWSNILF